MEDKEAREIIRQAGVTVDVLDLRTSEQIAIAIVTTGSPALVGYGVLKPEQDTVAQPITDTV